MLEEFDNDSLLDEEDEFFSNERRAKDVDNFLSEYRKKDIFSDEPRYDSGPSYDSEMDLVDLFAGNTY